MKSTVDFIDWEFKRDIIAVSPCQYLESFGVDNPCTAREIPADE